MERNSIWLIGCLNMGGSDSKWKDFLLKICKHANAGDLDSSLGWEDPLETRMATYSSILAWSLVGYIQWSHKELDITEQLNNNIYIKNLTFLLQKHI